MFVTMACKLLENLEVNAYTAIKFNTGENPEGQIDLLPFAQSVYLTILSMVCACFVNLHSTLQLLQNLLHTFVLGLELIM